MALHAGIAVCLVGASLRLDDHGMMMMVAEKNGLVVIGTDGGTAMMTETGGETPAVIVIGRGSETETQTAATDMVMIGPASPGVTVTVTVIGTMTLVAVGETTEYYLSVVERMYNDSLENTIDTREE